MIRFTYNYFPQKKRDTKIKYNYWLATSHKDYQWDERGVQTQKNLFRAKAVILFIEAESVEK